jgi:hypothetical protein
VLLYAALIIHQKATVKQIILAFTKYQKESDERDIALAVDS